VKVLFVCRGNVCRSRVGEQIFRVLSWSVGGRGDHDARSAGVDPDPGGRPVAGRDVTWADVICVMEDEHAAYIRKHWPGQTRKVRILGIPDVYEPDDQELRDRLTEVVRGLLAEGSGAGSHSGTQPLGPSGLRREVDPDGR
jgi:protein-tyrosine-phosphatase